MNSRVRRYQPLFILPQATRCTLQPSRTTTPNWKQFLNKEVDEYYTRIKSTMKKNEAESFANRKEEIQSTCISKNNQNSQIPSPQTKTSVKTPKKEQNSQIWMEGSFMKSTDSKIKQQHQRDNYRIKLIEQQCSYLRAEFINHCILKHHQEFRA